MENSESCKKLENEQNHDFQPKDVSLSWRLPFSSESDPEKVQKELRERIKELNCLYNISQLAERNLHSPEKLLQDLVNFLPDSWQYPENTCARIVFKGNTYTSEHFKVTDWRQSALIYIQQNAVGEVSIFYLEERPPSDEGPFLKEERALLDAVAAQIGTIATRILAEMELQETNRQLILERKALQESNAALHTVLSRIEEEKREIQRDIQTNVEKILKPIIHAMTAQLNPAQKKYLDMIQVNLDEITSPFVNQLSLSYHSMTPTEIAICSMIRTGMRTKEIAEIRGISEATVNRHREKIRHKLKITNKDVNLVTFLQSNMWDGK